MTSPSASQASGDFTKALARRAFNGGQGGSIVEGGRANANVHGGKYSLTRRHYSVQISTGE
jgi:hypothetical protein